MAEQTFNQDFKGYRRESKISTLPSESGVYGVYRCIFNKDRETVTLKELIYIGKADNLNDRINNHEDWPNWKAKLAKDEEICFCYTYVGRNDNERVEAALINSNKPSLNIEYKDSFPFDKTLVKCTGNHEFIKDTNVVNRH